MTTDIELERRLRRAALRAEGVTAEAVVARARRRRRRHRLFAGGLAAAIVLIAGVVTAAAIPNGATSVSVATGPNASSVPPITDTSKVAIRLTPPSAGPGTVIDATLTADKALAQISAADYLVVQTWTGARLKSRSGAVGSRSGVGGWCTASLSVGTTPARLGPSALLRRSATRQHQIRGRNCSGPPRLG